MIPILRTWRSAALMCFSLVVLLQVPAWAQGRFASRSTRALVEDFRMARPEEVGEVTAELFNRRAETASTLRGMLATGDREDRKVACSMLGELRDHDSVDSLLAASLDADVEVKAHAVSALRKVGDVRAAARFRQLLRNDTAASVLKRAMVGLGKLGAAHDVALLRPYLAHDEESVRVIAAGSLAMLGNGEGEDILLAATHSNHAAAQKDATGALGYVNSASARQRIGEIVNDPNGAWKSYAIIAQALHARAGAGIAQQVALLESSARSGNRIVASWALDELTDLKGAEASEAIARLSTRPSRIGQRAQLRARLREQVKEGQ